MRSLVLFSFVLFFIHGVTFVQSAGAVEYIDCTSGEG